MCVCVALHSCKLLLFAISSTMCDANQRIHTYMQTMHSQFVIVIAQCYAMLRCLSYTPQKYVRIIITILIVVIHTSEHINTTRICCNCVSQRSARVCVCLWLCEMMCKQCAGFRGHCLHESHFNTQRSHTARTRARKFNLFFFVSASSTCHYVHGDVVVIHTHVCVSVACVHVSRHVILTSPSAQSYALAKFVFTII